MTVGEDVSKMYKMEVDAIPFAVFTLYLHAVGIERCDGIGEELY